MLSRRFRGRPVLLHQFDTKTFERVFLLIKQKAGYWRSIESDLIYRLFDDRASRSNSR